MGPHDARLEEVHGVLRHASARSRAPALRRWSAWPSRWSWCSMISFARPARPPNCSPWAGSTTLTSSNSYMRSSDVRKSPSGRFWVGQAGDVRRDRGQQVVAGDEDAVGRLVEAEVVVGVARRVHRDPLPVTEQQHLAVDDPAGRLRRLPQPDEQQRHDAPPSRSRHCVVGRRAAPGQRTVERRVALAAGDLQQRLLDGPHLDVVVGRAPRPPSRSRPPRGGPSRS